MPRDAQLGREVPAGLIEEEDGMGAPMSQLSRKAVSALLWVVAATPVTRECSTSQVRVKDSAGLRYNKKGAADRRSQRSMGNPAPHSARKGKSLTE